MKAVIIPVTPFRQNCSLIWCEETRRGAVIDPGGDLDHIVEAVDARGVEIEKILLTHGHVDHAAGTVELKARLGVPVVGPHARPRGVLRAVEPRRLRRRRAVQGLGGTHGLPARQP